MNTFNVKTIKIQEPTAWNDWNVTAFSAWNELQFLLIPMQRILLETLKGTLKKLWGSSCEVLTLKRPSSRFSYLHRYKGRGRRDMYVV